MTRRTLLSRLPAALGGLALREASGAAPHFAPRAKSLIFIFMEGGPSQIDLCDPKPEMRRWDGAPLPESMRKDLRFAFIKPNAKVWASPRPFARHGKCGMEFSDLLPHTASQADKLCLIRSMHGDQFNHHPGQLLMHCGSPMPGRPSMGAWLMYGLGSESRDLPGFVTLGSGRAGIASSAIFGSGFLPAAHQGVPFARTGEAVSYLTSPDGMDRGEQRARVDTINALNRRHRERTGDAAIDARVASYELAFRMQMAAPELLDLSKEPKETIEMYGADREPTAQLGRNCLLARRMVERGVRFVLLAHASWDDHANLASGHAKSAAATDRPCAALIADLDRRGLLDQTLVLWGGEFGRTPLAQTLDPGRESATGRDHHPDAFSMWMAGGGIRRGVVHGRTDDLCMKPVEGAVHVNDLHATILRCMGIDHLRLTYPYQGRNFRLTDVAGRVVEDILA